MEIYSLTLDSNSKEFTFLKALHEKISVRLNLFKITPPTDKKGKNSGAESNPDILISRLNSDYPVIGVRRGISDGRRGGGRDFRATG